MAAYPQHLIRERRLANGHTVVIRPIRAEDEAGERRFFEDLSPETRRLRFMKFVREVGEPLIRRFTRLDYETSMAFVCEATVEGEPRIVGEARYAAIADSRSCEFAVVVADAWRRSGIAGLLMEALMRTAQEHGYETMEGLVLRENAAERRFARALGFEEFRVAGDATAVRVAKKLNL